MAIKPSRKDITSESGTSCPARPDPLDAFDLTESERADLLAALRRIVCHFVDLAFEGDALLCLSSSEDHLATAEGERLGPPDPGQEGEQS